MEGSEHVDENGVWWLDGNMMVYNNLRLHMDEADGQHFLYMTNSKDWYHTGPNRYIFFACEKEPGTITCVKLSTILNPLWTA